MRIDTSTNPNNAIRQELRRFDNHDKFFIEEITDISKLNFLNLNQEGEKAMNWKDDIQTEEWTDEDYKKQSQIKKQNIVNSFNDPVGLIEVMQAEGFLQDEIEEALDEKDLRIYLIDEVNARIKAENKLKAAVKVAANHLNVPETEASRIAKIEEEIWQEPNMKRISELVDKINYKKRIADSLERNNNLT